MRDPVKADPVLQHPQISLFALDVILVLVAWPAILWLAHFPIGLLSSPFDPRGLVYPLSDFLFLYAMGLYRREAFVENRRSAMRVPLMTTVALWLSKRTMRLRRASVE